MFKRFQNMKRDENENDPEENRFIKTWNKFSTSSKNVVPHTFGYCFLEDGKKKLGGDFFIIFDEYKKSFVDWFDDIKAEIANFAKQDSEKEDKHVDHYKQILKSNMKIFIDPFFELMKEDYFLQNATKPKDLERKLGYYEKGLRFIDFKDILSIKEIKQSLVEKISDTDLRKIQKQNFVVFISMILFSFFSFDQNTIWFFVEYNLENNGDMLNHLFKSQSDFEESINDFIDKNFERLLPKFNVFETEPLFISFT